MKSASAGLLTLLASRQFYMVDLYTITIVGGGVLRYCSGDVDIVSGGNTFTAGGTTGPYFELDGGRPLAKWKAGLEVDTMSIDVLPKNATVQGVSFQTAIKNGLFDAADFQCERAYMPTYGNVSAGTIVIFSGRVGEISPVGRQKATFTINSHLELLNISLPRNLYQASCVNTLGDSACGIALGSYGVSGSCLSPVAAGFIWATLGQATGYFSYGKVLMTSGANSGLSRGVRAYTNGNPSLVQLLSPFPQPPAIGDTFTIYPGCDKAMTTCFSKFNNIARFRGQPFIPENSTAV
jgi:uncharacterized phage protein (TIGR02218 family)